MTPPWRIGVDRKRKKSAAKPRATGIKVDKNLSEAIRHLQSL
jgi:hypothetical protein